MTVREVVQRIWVDERPYSAALQARECGECGESVISGRELRRAGEEIRREVGSYSGKLLLRITPAAHKSMTDLAAERGISVNELCRVFLEEGLRRTREAA